MDPAQPAPREDRAARLPDPASLLGGGAVEHRVAVARIVLRAALLIAPLLLLAYGIEAVAPRLRGLRARATGQVTGQRAAEERGGIVEAAPEPTPPPSPESIARNQRSWVDSVTIAPREDRVDPRTGERTGAFVGFGLQIDRPAGATAWVDGEEKGTTPLLTTVACEPGAEVEVVVERAGQRARALTRCRRDTLVKLDLELPRAGASGAAGPARHP